MVSRKELQHLALARAKDAEILCKAGRYNAAAEMCGYVLEFALKACVCHRLRIREYPETSCGGKAFKTHDYSDLLLLSGLKEIVSELDVSSDLRVNWDAASGWRPEDRYKVGKVDQSKAEGMLKALRATPNGVLSWLKKRW